VNSIKQAVEVAVASWGVLVGVMIGVVERTGVLVPPVLTGVTVGLGVSGGQEYCRLNSMSSTHQPSTPIEASVNSKNQKLRF
jgi:hypothetical protein